MVVNDCVRGRCCRGDEVVVAVAVGRMWNHPVAARRILVFRHFLCRSCLRSIPAPRLCAAFQAETCRVGSCLSSCRCVFLVGDTW